MAFHIVWTLNINKNMIKPKWLVSAFGHCYCNYKYNNKQKIIVSCKL